jgi:hypothetical protein
MAQNYKCYGGGPNSIGPYSCICNPPTYNIDGSIASWSHAHEAEEACSGGAMVTPNGNAMPIRAEKQKTGIKKRNVANRSRRQRYSNMNHTTKPVPAPLPPCYICEEETNYTQNSRGDLYQSSGCYFDEFGEVYMAPDPNGYTSSIGVRENCPMEGWNSDGIYVTTNPPSSSGGVSSWGVSSGTTRPTRPKKKKIKLGSRVQKRVQGFSGDWYNRY